MAKLAAIGDLRTRLGEVPDEDKITQRMDDALEHITELLRGEVRTSFDRTVRTDEFFFEVRHDPSKTNFARFLLNQGFVDAGETFEVRMANTIEDLAAQDPIAASLYRLSAERGTLLLVGSDALEHVLSRRGLGGEGFVQIDYTAGFALDANGDELGDLYDQTQVPERFRRLALTLSEEVYRALGEDTLNRAKAKLHIGSLGSAAMVEQWVRYEPSAFRALVRD